jgi:tRNA (guanine6-N2)-methyltransferase
LICDGYIDGSFGHISVRVNKIFALTTRGLETISAQELAALPGVTVDQIAYRRVFATCKGPLTTLLNLRTVDDVFLYVTTWSGIDRPRSTLSVLTAVSAQLPLDRIAIIRAQGRSIPSPPTFSVTANFVGKRNYSTAEIKQACAAGILERQGWIYSENDQMANLNVRIFIEGDTAVVGIRLGDRPLSKRPYMQHTVPGSLKPAVAAALVSLVGVAPGLRVLDPCCGAGTILIEARLSGVKVWGGDTYPQAVTATRINAATAGAAVHVQRWDARALPLADKSVDRVISNLPWGRVVSTPGTLAALYEQIGEEIRRVLAPGGQTVLLTNQPDLVQIKGLKCDTRIEISLFGQTPTIMVWTDPSILNEYNR